ncbi:MAG: hypothetical protein ACLSWY_01660 [Ruthenibacterium lactatiformans]
MATASASSTPSTRYGSNAVPKAMSAYSRLSGSPASANASRMPESDTVSTRLWPLMVPSTERAAPYRRASFLESSVISGQP